MRRHLAIRKNNYDKLKIFYVIYRHKCIADEQQLHGVQAGVRLRA